MTNSVSNSSNYDYSHILELHGKIGTKDITQEERTEYYSTRANNPELDRALYDQDKAEIMDLSNKIQEIMRKVARGENLSKEEQEMVNNDADLKQKIDEIRQEKESTENALKNASPEQAQVILNSMMTEMSGKKEYTPEDMAKMEMLQQYIYKYGNKDSDEKSTYEKMFAQNLRYEYEA